MKILFLCGSLEPGFDGVGDYTRRLAGELIRQNHQAKIIALNDNSKIIVTEEEQEIEGTSVPVMRIPNNTPTTQRLNTVKQSLVVYNPDWISLQFVPYSFNAKGLPFWLPSFLKKLKGKHKWHIMFHELWLGIDIESSFKHKCIGKFQQLIIEKVIHNTNTNLVNTQNKLYQYFLNEHQINSEVLPICGNIPFTAVKKENIDCTQFVLFGAIHYGAPFDDFIEDLNNISNQLVKPIKFIFIGKNGSELENYITILTKYNIGYQVLGIQSEEVISEVLVNSDFGISTTPYFQSEKSGVYAAYREHQVNTICVSRQWTPTQGQYRIPQIIRYEKNNLNIIQKNVEVFDLQSMTKQFINSISIS
ncbi:glycosyltransferase [Flavobacterium adhaerens]|uniref:glycosyltransferase n=1 Tax=Flavobacterium adhaerens TaxID=3149043 RepID=UPI0032B61F96